MLALQCMLMCGVSDDRGIGFDSFSLAVWWLYGWFVGGVVCAIVVVVWLVGNARPFVAFSL